VNLDFLDGAVPPRVIAVSSAVSGEGRTTVAANLAVVMAQAGRSVLVIDGDLRRPGLTAALGVADGPHLAEVLTGSVDVDDAIRPAGELGFSVLPAGPPLADPGQLLASELLGPLIEKLRGSYDAVLIDTPPLLPVADAVHLATVADGVLLCVRFRSTHEAELGLARNILHRVGARILGVTVTMAVGPRVPAAHQYAEGRH
jgi:receptor protein-tyrosine kinase